MAADDWLIEAARAGMKPSPYDAPKKPPPPPTEAETAEFYQQQTAAAQATDAAQASDAAPGGRCNYCATPLRRNMMVDVWYCVRCKPAGR